MCNLRAYSESKLVLSNVDRYGSDQDISGVFTNEDGAAGSATIFGVFFSFSIHRNI